MRRSPGLDASCSGCPAPCHMTSSWQISTAMAGPRSTSGINWETRCFARRCRQTLQFHPGPPCTRWLAGCARKAWPLRTWTGMVAWSSSPASPGIVRRSARVMRGDDTRLRWTSSHPVWLSLTLKTMVDLRSSFLKETPPSMARSKGAVVTGVSRAAVPDATSRRFGRLKSCVMTCLTPTH